MTKVIFPKWTTEMAIACILCD